MVSGIDMVTLAWIADGVCAPSGALPADIFLGVTGVADASGCCPGGPCGPMEVSVARVVLPAHFLFGGRRFAGVRYAEDESEDEASSPEG